MTPTPTQARSRQARRRERGSLFLISLLVLGLITVVGLSLVTITETEMALGTNEWVLAETHFAAESALQSQLAQLLVTNDLSPIDIVVPSYFGDLNRRDQLGFDLKSSAAFPITMSELPYSKVNEDSSDALLASYMFTHVRAQRASWARSRPVPDCDDLQNVLAQKHLRLGYYFLPAERLQSDALLAMERAALDAEFGRSTADSSSGTPLRGTGRGAYAFCDSAISSGPVADYITFSDSTLIDDTTAPVVP